MSELPPYLFVEIDKAKRRLLEEGKDVIDLGVGDPDLPTSPHVIERLKSAVDDPANHRYSFTEGIPELREAIARWYERRFGVTLDPQTEILPLLGSKEGLAHFPLAIANPGDVVLVPDPCYPPYRAGTILAGAEAVSVPLVEENGFFPDLGAISQKAARRAKVLFLNYPNNPTAAVAQAGQFLEAIALAKEYGFAIAHDAAYSEISYDPSTRTPATAGGPSLGMSPPTGRGIVLSEAAGRVEGRRSGAPGLSGGLHGFRPVSFLQLPDAKAVGIEFHSLSKTYNMTGWRIGWACGNATLIAALCQLKTNLDSGIFQPIQWAGITALEGDQAPLQQAVATYQERRDLFVAGLAKAGWRIPKPPATFYVWARVPTQESSMAFAARVLADAHVVATPGVGFGPAGEGYVRFSLTIPTARIREAVVRLTKVL